MAAWPRAIMRACIPVCAAIPYVSTSALAHGDHGGGGGNVLPQGTTLVTFDVEYTKFKPISDARLTDLALQGVAEVHSLKSIAVPTVALAYGVTNDLTVGVRLPYLANREIRETDPDNGGVNARGGVYGIGDTTVTATYRVLREASAGLDAAAIAGVKVPTGRNDAVDKNGELFETEHQPGSGSWDGVFGFSLAKQVGPVGLSANGLYGLAGDGDRNTNLGDRFSYGIGVSYRLLTSGNGGSHMHLGADRPAGIMHHGGVDHNAPASPFGPMTVDLLLGLNGEWHDQQTVDGVRDGNTGGHVLYVSPGVQFATQRTATTVTLAIPVATQLNGIQSEPDWRLTSSFGVKF